MSDTVERCTKAAMEVFWSMPYDVTFIENRQKETAAALAALRPGDEVGEGCVVVSKAELANSDHITVWRFDDAPERLRELSTNGGDEDWLALVPPKFSEYYLRWLEVPYFAVCTVDEMEDPAQPGWRVYIGCHA